MCNAFDLYCWRLVGEAFTACKVRGVPATGLYRLVVHVQCGGKCADFQLHSIVDADPDDPRGFHSKAEEWTEFDRLGVDDSWIARSAYAKFRTVLQKVIHRSEPYVPPARVEMA